MGVARDLGRGGCSEKTWKTIGLWPEPFPIVRLLGLRARRHSVSDCRMKAVLSCPVWLFDPGQVIFFPLEFPPL